MMIESQVSVSPMVRPNPGNVLRRPAAALTMHPAQARRNDLELVLAEFALGEACLVLPSQQHVADTALHEGDGRAARTGIKHRHVLVEVADELLCLVGGTGFLQRVAPGGKIIPARAAG